MRLKIKPGQYGLWCLDDDPYGDEDAFCKPLLCLSELKENGYYDMVWEHGTIDEIFAPRLRKVFTKEEYPEMYL